VPRRNRPPLTAREIGAWLCGRRAARQVGTVLLTHPEVEGLALKYAIEDEPLWVSMSLRDYMHWFCQGYYSAPGVRNYR
jgi:hypothetical protein